MNAVFDVLNIDFSKKTKPTLQAIVIGPSGAGKSYSLRSYTGRVLYLHDATESHGKDAASGGKATILPINIAKNPATGEDLSAKESYELILQLLTPEVIKKYKADCIVIDSLTGLERIIRRTPVWAAKCLTAQGKHNNFQETPATLELIDNVLKRLVSLSETIGVDYIVTCAASVTDIGENGEYTAVKPSLMAYGVAEGTIQQFADVLLIGPVSKKTKDGVVTKHCFQFLGSVKRVSKNEEGEIRKMFNFRPRITGADAENLQAFLLADLDEVKKLKNA